MKRLATAAFVVAATGCAASPPQASDLPPCRPVIMQSERPRIDPRLLADCCKPMPEERSAREYTDVMEARGDCIDECNRRLAKARKENGQ